MSDKQVYAIKHPDGYFKIGVSEAPRERVRKIQRATPKQLELWATVHCGWGANKVEGRVHAELADDHVRGEWFEVDGDGVLSLFREEVDKDPDGVEVGAVHITRPEWKPEPAVPKGVLGEQ